MAEVSKTQKVLVVGAGPVGALAALYAANRGDDVHVYELRAGKTSFILILSSNSQENCWLSYLILLPKEYSTLLYFGEETSLPTDSV